MTFEILPLWGLEPRKVGGINIGPRNSQSLTGSLILTSQVVESQDCGFVVRYDGYPLQPTDRTG